MTTALMTAPERLVYNWLTKNNIPFDFQTSMAGGRLELGGMVVDFILQDRPIAIRVQGEYWHKGVVKEARDRVQREILHGIGYIVVDVYEDDLNRNLDMVMNRAMEGREMSEIDSDLWFPYMGMAFGEPTFAGVTSLVAGYGQPDSGSVVAATVRTDAATYGYILNGTLTYDGGGDCSVRFQWGESTSYGHDTLWQTGKLTNATFSCVPGVLTVGTTYHFRAQARNKYSTVNGDDASFVASAPGTTFSIDFYPDAHPETSSVDGMTQCQNVNPDYSWATMHDGGGTLYAEDDNNNIIGETLIQGFQNPDIGFLWSYMRRSIVCFDTSSIGSGATIVSSTLTLCCGGVDLAGSTKTDTRNILPSTNIYSANPASTIALVGADYNTLGATPYCDAPITYANWGSNDGDYVSFVFNSTGLLAISKTGITKMGVRNANYDAVDAEPAHVGIPNNEYLYAWTRFFTADGAVYYDNPDYRPKLTVTYTSPV